ncbi:MAG: hypothetical protein HGA74_07500 [Deltaproteobacteria bacterium]|nr:hypothetical protein [Deltaproteobacteria bacterium]
MQARIDDTEINFEIDGPEGASVVTFSHSLAASLDMWESQLAAMLSAFKVTDGKDFRLPEGFGRSEGILAG